LGLAVNVVVVLDAAPAVNVTLAFNTAPSTVAVTVFIPACVDAKVVVKTPEPLVVPEASENVLAVPVALMTTVAPITGLLTVLSTVTVRVVVVLPSATSDVGLGTMVEFVVLTVGAVNVTLVVLVKLPATSALTVLVCTVVDASVAENVPAALVVPDTGENTLLVPVDDKDTDCPETGFPWASTTVVVRMLVLVPSAATEAGLAINVVVVLLAAPAVNVTLVVAFAGPAVPVMLFASALVDSSVAVNTPELFVVPEFGLNVLLEPVLPRLTACPDTALP
jgi:hypothetical protein